MYSFFAARVFLILVIRRSEDLASTDLFSVDPLRELHDEPAWRKAATPKNVRKSWLGNFGHIETVAVRRNRALASNFADAKEPPSF